MWQTAGDIILKNHEIIQRTRVRFSVSVESKASLMYFPLIRRAEALAEVSKLLFEIKNGEGKTPSQIFLDR